MNILNRLNIQLFFLVVLSFTSCDMYDGRAVDMREMLDSHTPDLNISYQEVIYLQEYILTL